MFIRKRLSIWKIIQKMIDSTQGLESLIFYWNNSIYLFKNKHNIFLYSRKTNQEV